MYTKEYYEKNKDRYKEYYEKNKEDRKRYQKEYYEKNKKKIREKFLNDRRTYYEKNGIKPKCNKDCFNCIYKDCIL